MKKISATMKGEALQDLKMNFGEPPYDIGHVRLHRSSGIFEQQALERYGEMPLELIKELHRVPRSEKTKEEALKDLTMYFFEYRKT